MDFCVSGPFMAVFGADVCVSKSENMSKSETYESPKGLQESRHQDGPILEMEDSMKVLKSVSNIRQLDSDKTDSESSRSNSTTSTKDSPKRRLTDIQILKTIGSGRFGFVKIGYCHDISKFVILNSYQKSILSDTCQQHIPKREKDILEMLSHPFTTKLIGSFQDDSSLYLMLQVPHGGDLSRLLFASQSLQKSLEKGNSQIKTFTNLQNLYKLKSPLIEQHKVFYAACIVSVFKYAHSKNILHRGLHPDTLYIDEFGYLKVCDWGFAKVVDDHTFTLCGHVEYLCPEAILYDSGYGKGADYWALGVLIYEMLAGRSAFVARSRQPTNMPVNVDDDASKNRVPSAPLATAAHDHTLSPCTDSSSNGFDDASTVENIISAQIEFPSYFSATACSIISGLCQKNPAVRLGCVKNSRGVRDIMSHPWFSGIDWEKLEARELLPPWTPSTDGFHDFKFFGDGYHAEDNTIAFDGYHHVEWNSF